jgi:hypothetical protein
MVSSTVSARSAQSPDTPYPPSVSATKTSYRNGDGLDVFASQPSPRRRRGKRAPVGVPEGVGNVHIGWAR